MNRFRLVLVACCTVGLVTSSSTASADTIYVSDPADFSIRKFDSTSGAGSTFFFGFTVLGVALKGDGNLYAGVIPQTLIDKFPLNGPPDGSARTIFASLSLGGQGNATRGMAFDSAGNLFVACGDNTIQKITPAGTVSVFATNVASPKGLALDSLDNIFVASSPNTVTKITAAGVVSIFATTGLNNPFGIAVDKSDNIYVSNGGDNTIEKFTQSGIGSVFASTNLNSPQGLAFDSARYLYAANQDGKIRKFATDGSSTPFASVASGNVSFIAILVPEPSGIALAVFGFVGLLAWCWRRRKR